MLLATLLVVLSCLTQPEPAPATPVPASEAAPKYVCPMKCEGDKTYDQAGRCPVCEMKLKLQVPPTSPKATVVEPKPDDLHPGTKTRIGLALTGPGAPAPGTTVSLLIVAADATWCDRSESKVDTQSNITAECTFPHSGEYVLVVVPASGQGLKPLGHTKLAVPGPAPNLALWPPAGAPAKLEDGITVTFAPAIVSGGEQVDATVQVERRGQPTPAPQPAKATRLVVLSADFETAGLFEPVRAESGRSTFKLNISKPGRYLSIVEVEVAGKTLRAITTFEATPRMR